MRIRRLIFAVLTFFAVIPSVGATCFLGIGDCEVTSQPPYCNTPGECSIQQGTDIVQAGINDLEKNKTASQYLQDVVAYLLAFLGILGVLYIIYAGFNMVTAGGDDKKVTESKTTITRVALGLVLIFLAYSIMRFVVSVVNTSDQTVGFSDFFFDRAYAAGSQPDYRSFAGYKESIELLMADMERQFTVNGKISVPTLRQLGNLVTESRKTFPTDKDVIYNTNLSNKVTTAIDVLLQNTESEEATQSLGQALVDFVTKIKIQRVAGKADATPKDGNAPLTVTLRAVDVVDPSGVIVPKENFVWWLKASDGSRNVIGTGPSFAYTFREERVYTVFLDVASASRNSYGKSDVLPLQTNINIAVQPRIGTIRLFVNGADVSDLDRIKIMPKEGRAGVLFDATATEISAGTRIVSTTWNFGNGRTVTRDGFPRIEQVVYGNEGTYAVSLTMRTNDNTLIKKTFDVDVRDPIARITADTTERTAQVGKQMHFGASTAYGDMQLRYGWQIVDLKSGDVVFTSSLKNITYAFTSVGKYQIRLSTTTPLAKEDTDTMVIEIEPRDPIVSFDTKFASQERPNVVTLDATRSYDPDTFNNSELQYSWSVDGQDVELENPSRNGGLGQYTFNTLGTHRVVLKVRNGGGREATVSKDVQVQSLLSVEIGITPRIVHVGDPVAFIVNSPNAALYEWNFGDGTTDTTNTGRNTHVFTKAGSNSVTVSVRASNSQTKNSISREVYVVAANSPAASLEVMQDGQPIEKTANQCSGKPAYVVNRATPVTLDSQKSINPNGQTQDMEYSWKYANARSSNQANFSYKFDELGCTPVTIMVTDKKGKTRDSRTEWINVVNLPPQFTSLTISADPSKDPVVANVTAVGATDPDGVIVSYLWYYYTDNDPEPQDFRVTRTPQTSFVIPRITGTYYFGVVMEDSNGAKINSNEARDERYSLAIASDNINTPLLALKASNTSVFTGDPITFDVSTKNVLGKEITENIEYKWDYDGDGFYDETTKAGHVTHAYPLPGSYPFKVKATYKGISNTKSVMITVRNVLKPDFDATVIGNKIVLVNTTEGVYTKATWKAGDWTSDNMFSAVRDFGQNFPETVTLSVSDGETTKDVTKVVASDRRNALRVEKYEGHLIYFTYPEAVDGTVTLDRQGEPLYVYLGESKAGDTPIARYSVDTDTSVDTDLNGSPNDDADNAGDVSAASGTPYLIRTFPSGNPEQTMRLSLYSEDGTLIDSADIKVLLPFNKPKVDSATLEKQNASLPQNISDADKVGLEKLKDLVRQAPEGLRLYLMEYVSKLQESWFDQREKTRTIIDMQEYVSNAASLNAQQKAAFYDLLDGFVFAQDQARDDVTLAANVIRNLVPKTNKQYATVDASLNEILSHPTNTVENKKLGSAILDIVKADSTISDSDKMIIRAQMEVIVYGGKAAIPANQAPATDTTASDSGFLSKLTGILWYVVIGFLAIIGLFVFAFVALYVVYRTKSGGKNTGFQDFVIDLFTKKGGKGSAGGNIAAPKAPAPAPAPVPKADPLATSASVADPLAASAAVVPDAPQDMPSWLKDASAGSAAIPAAPVATGTETATVQAPVGEQVPDWLRQTPSDTPTAAPVSAETPAADESMPAWLRGADTSATIPDETPAPVTEPASEQTAQNDLPDWLRQDASAEADVASTAENVPTAPAFSETPTAASETQDDVPDWLKQTTAEPSATEPEPAVTEPAPTPAAASADDLPDWLRGVDRAALEAEVHEELSADRTSETSDVTPAPASVPTVASAEEDDIPDWLKGSFGDGTSAPTEAAPAPAEPMPSTAAIPVAPVETAQSTGEPVFDAPAPAAASADDLPDWLRDWNSDASEPTPVASVPAAEEAPAATSQEDDIPDWLKQSMSEAIAEPEKEKKPKRATKKKDDASASTATEATPEVETPAPIEEPKKPRKTPARKKKDDAAE